MMVHPDVQLALARDRSEELRATAAAWRRARQAKAAAASPAGASRTRWLRFLGRKTTLTEADLRYFTDVDHHFTDVDHHDHEALGHVRGGGVGIARDVTDRENPAACACCGTPGPAWSSAG